MNAPKNIERPCSKIMYELKFPTSSSESQRSLRRRKSIMKIKGIAFGIAMSALMSVTALAGKTDSGSSGGCTLI